MTRREAVIVFSVLILSVLISLVIAIMPREYVRRLRHSLSRLVMWQWSKHGRFSAIVHDWFWQKGNGH
jgi:hypothetical protein